MAVLGFPSEVKMKSLIFAFCVVFACGDLRAQTSVWQPAPGRTQIPIWPGAAPDAEAVPGPESYTTTTKLIAGKPAVVVNKYYGSAGKWRKILEANRGTVEDANTVRAGTKLIIPD